MKYEYVMDVHAHACSCAWFMHTFIMSLAYNPLLDTNMIRIIKQFLLLDPEPQRNDYNFRLTCGGFNAGVVRCRLRSISRAWYKTVTPWQINDEVRFRLIMQPHQVIMLYKYEMFHIIRDMNILPRVVLERVDEMTISGESPYPRTNNFIETAISIIASRPFQAINLDCVPITKDWDTLKLHPLTETIRISNGRYNPFLYVYPSDTPIVLLDGIVRKQDNHHMDMYVIEKTDVNADDCDSYLSLKDNVIKCLNRHEIEQLVIEFLCTRILPSV